MEYSIGFHHILYKDARGESYCLKKNLLKITFHNPNTSDETAKFLIKIIADNIVSKVEKRPERSSEDFFSFANAAQASANTPAAAINE